MIPQVAGEYKLVLVGDSAVGTTQYIQENHLFSASLLTVSMMSTYSLRSESTLNSER